MSAVTIHLGPWTQLGAAALAIREQVFVAEQGVPRELEHDAEDPACVHAVAYRDALPIGTGRLTPGGHIGRMAVLRERRGRGVGTRILVALLARAGNRPVALNAQLHAIPFYEHLGFVATGPTFDDAGIPHRRMHFRRSGLARMLHKSA